MKASLPLRLWPLILITLTTIISILLVIFRTRRNIGHFDLFVRNHRSVVAVLVQVASSTLAAGQVVAVSCLFNFFARLRLQQNGLSLQALRIWKALSGPHFELSVRPMFLLLLALVILMTKVYEALWAGALTPVFEDHRMETGTIKTPLYPVAAASIWSSEYSRGSNGVFTGNTSCETSRSGGPEGVSGVKTSCPATYLIGGLLGAASDATPLAPSIPRRHPKIDQSGWTYIGRSYGVGASPGTVELPHPPSPINYTTFDYIELGYLPTVSCAQNQSSNYEIITPKTISPYEDNTQILFFKVNGTLPNSLPGQVQEYFLWSDKTDLLAWSVMNGSGQNIVSVAGMGKYSGFDKMQCSVTFKPTEFSVRGNITEKTIAVTPVTDSKKSDPEDIEPTGQLITNTLYGLEVVSRASGNGFTSMLGTAVGMNLEVLGLRKDLALEPTVQVYSRALESSIEAIIDDILIGFATYQVGTTYLTKTKMFATYSTVRVGSELLIFGNLGVNLLLLLLVTFEAIRTRLWRQMTDFDFTDVQSIIVAASAGGEHVALAAGRGPPGEMAGNVMVKVQHDGNNNYSVIKSNSLGTNANSDKEGYALLDESSIPLQSIPGSR